jgi:hypothetical protein
MPKTVISESENRTVVQFLWEGHVNEKNPSRVPGEIAGTATTSRTAPAVCVSENMADVSESPPKAMRPDSSWSATPSTATNPPFRVMRGGFESPRSTRVESAMIRLMHHFDLAKRTGAISGR